MTEQRPHLELYAAALVRNRDLSVLIAGLVLVIGCLVGALYRLQPQVATVLIGVDALGRHEVLDAEETLTDTERLAVIRGDIITFVVRHFSRRHGAAGRDFADSLWFLEPGLRRARQQEIEPSVRTFISTTTAEEIDVKNLQVKLDEQTKRTYKAQVDFEQHYALPGARLSQKPLTRHTAMIAFEARGAAPSAFQPINPLGLQITYLRVDDQAFQ